MKSQTQTLTGRSPRSPRNRLPDERKAITHKFSIAGHEGYIIVGLFEDGSPGEVFLRMAKEGSTLAGLAAGFSVAVSWLLQLGMPLEDLVTKFSYTRFEPAGFTANPDLPIATSVFDYLFRWMSVKFLSGSTEEKEFSESAPPCNGCGDIMTRTPKQYVCPQCGAIAPLT